MSDSGIGIDIEDQEIIFKEFEQLNSGLSRKYGGIGLGLALAKRYVDLHHGRIWVTSKGKNLGSIFSFSIPIKKEER